MKKFRLHLPVHYLVLVLVALAVLVGLLQVYGPNRAVLIGWAIVFLVVSRLVDLIYRRRRRARLASTSPGTGEMSPMSEGRATMGEVMGNFSSTGLWASTPIDPRCFAPWATSPITGEELYRGAMRIAPSRRTCSPLK